MPSIPNYPNASIVITRNEKDSNNNTATQKFILKKGEVKNLRLPKVQQGATITFAGQTQSDSDSITVNLGVNKELSIEFKLLFEDFDRADGTSANFLNSNRNINMAIKDFGTIQNYMDYSFFDAGLGGTVTYDLEIADKFRYWKAKYSLNELQFQINDSLYPKGNLKFKHLKNIL